MSQRSFMTFVVFGDVSFQFLTWILSAMACGIFVEKERPLPADVKVELPRLPGPGGQQPLTNPEEVQSPGFILLSRDGKFVVNGEGVQPDELAEYLATGSKKSAKGPWKALVDRRASAEPIVYLMQCAQQAGAQLDFAYLSEEELPHEDHAKKN